MTHWTLPRPAGSAQLMIALARGEYGLSLETCVEGTGLRGPALVDPACEIVGQQELGVLRNILRALGPAVPFGLEAGLRYRATTHGMWGLALIAAPNVGEAFEFGVRYGELTYSFNRLGFEADARQARLLYDDGDNPDDLRAALVERDLAAFIALQRDTLGYAVPLQALRLRAPRPAYAARFEPIFGVAPEFAAPANSVGLDVALLDLASPLANERTFRECEAQCRGKLEELGRRSGVAGQVRWRILREVGEFPSMATVSADLGMSTRTLRNRLACEGTSYRELLEGTRQTLAEELLSARRLNVDQIASRLGYADPSSFIAAFKRWKGVSPREYRAR